MHDNIDYGAVFGVSEELAAAEGAKEQESAAPAEDNQEAQGEKAQEPAAPAADDDKDTQPGTGSATSDEGGEKPPQSPEERARYAAARRKAEQERDAAIAQARQEAQAESQKQLDTAIAALGLMNPYTKQPITNKAELDTYQKQYQEEKQNQILQKSGMSQEEFQRLVQGMPVVQQAHQAKAQADAALKKIRRDAAQARMEAQIQEIHQMDPSISSVEDLAKSENYDALLKKVRDGYQLVDAYKLVNWDRLQQQNADKAKQAARNAAAGKTHLQPTGSRGAGAVSVPENVKAEYRAFMPGATDEEIQKHWETYQKSLKK